MIPEIEKATHHQIKIFQEEALKKLLDYLNKNSAFYQRLFNKHGIDINTINSLEDLQKIPCVTKENLQLYTQDFLCVPTSKIIDYVTTSGTLGDPVSFALTRPGLFVTSRLPQVFLAGKIQN